VYKHSFHSQWDGNTRPWFHQANPWPWLVDTRRTVDPSFEVGKAQQKEICQQFERNLMRSKRPTIDLTEQKTRYTMSGTQSRDRFCTEPSKNDVEIRSLKPDPQTRTISIQGGEIQQMHRSRSASGCASRQSARKSFTEGVVANIQQKLLSEYNKPLK
jgi:hypothetical protein